jgi:lipopolysaccharide/colanic/teichoic acid biosynthesis glycosyltransferase
LAKRVFDLVASLVGLLVLAPVFWAFALAIRIDSPGPIFFRQERVGLGGRTFRIHKFRSMVLDAERVGGQLTVGADPRVTHVGRWLRRYKLDELPQLIDVFLGDMSLVGPRPEVPRYVANYPTDLRALLQSVRPGITDPASIRFRDESELLATADDPERVYVEQILPQKLALYADYVRQRTLWGDIAIILATLRALAR